MADKQLSLKQDAGDNLFADDDPLAALARIASFEPQGESHRKPLAVRREPEFNLEDELLKEFEQYEEPAATVAAPELHAGQPVAIAAEPVAAAPPAFDDDGTFDSQAVFGDEAPAAAPLLAVEPDVPLSQPLPELRAVPAPSYVDPTEPVRPAAHPVFDLEDELLKEFAAFDARRLPRGEGKPSVPPVLSPAPEPAFKPAATPVAVAPARVEPDFADTFPHDHASRSGYGDEYAADEPAVATTPELDLPALDAMEAEVDPGRWREAREAIFDEEEQAASPVSGAALSADDGIEEPALFEAAPVARERWDDEIATEAAAHIDIASRPEPALDIDIEPEVFEDADFIEAETIVPAARPASESVFQPQLSKDPDFDLDELLADVQRFPVQPEPVVSTAAAPQIHEPAFVSRKQPLVEPEITPARSGMPSADASFKLEAAVPPAAVATPTATSVAETIVPPVAKEETAARTSARHHTGDDFDVFDETDFELDLTEIELDMLEMEVASSVTPALRDDLASAGNIVPDKSQDVSVRAKPPVSSERHFEPQPAPAEDYSSLPFDPSQVSSEEDPVTAISEMDVPETPVVDHQEEPVQAEPDYDIDIDAEMAHIFSRPAEPAGAAKPGQPAQAALASTDLDEFERALEEDFRRSLSENRATGTPDRVALTPASYEDTRREGSTGRRILVLAASVAGLVLVGGAGVYAYWGNSGRLLTVSGEPRIILADKDPVKVEPKDRGGQVVPNQDKAVYDRVSGDNKELTKQDRLVTSNEEPVDVVQKTLMPENLPLDDDQSATDTTDTTDPRLLPDQQKNVSTDEATDGVSPRKVRTMVVRSDGTLVPREEEPVVAGDKAPAEQSQERSLDITPASTDNVPERLTANDDIAKQINEASADKSFVPEAKQPADADRTTPAATEQPVTADADAVSADQAADLAAAATDQPVTDDSVDAKPDTVPVKKSDLAAATPTTDTTDAKPADTAAKDDSTSGQPAATETSQSDDTAKATEVKAATLHTPIPVSRPVDQPVDIVGRVTDRGNVQKNQEVASVESSGQPVQTTATPAGAYVIQIASLPSEAEAQKSYTKLSARFASVIGGHGVDIRKAEIKNKGTYYRVRIVAGSRQEATDLCGRYKAAGGTCLVSK